MKKVILFILFAVLSLLVVNAQNTAKKNNPVGTWKFETPNAPEGYTSGSIIVGIAEKKYTASMVFDISEYKFTGERVKFENDSLFFSLYTEGQEVAVSLKLASATRMSGKAVYSEGEIPLTLLKSAIEVKAKTKQ